MMDMLLGLLIMAASAYGMSLALSGLKFFRKRHRVAQHIARMRSGIFVEHGMIMNPETGEFTPQNKPSQQAHSHIS